jgi:hypothetical protein
MSCIAGSRRHSMQASNPRDVGGVILDPPSVGRGFAGAEQLAHGRPAPA